MIFIHASLWNGDAGIKSFCGESDALTRIRLRSIFGMLLMDRVPPLVFDPILISLPLSTTQSSNEKPNLASPSHPSSPTDASGICEETQRHRHHGRRLGLWRRRVLRRKTKEPQDSAHRPVGQGGPQVHQRLLLGLHLHAHPLLLSYRNLRISQKEHRNRTSQFPPDHPGGHLHPARYAQASRV